MDILFEKLDPGDFLTFISLCIAAFSFLCQYLSFPKNFLKNLAILNQEKLNNLNDGENSKKIIIKYFFVIDLFTAWILVFLIFAMICSLGFLTVSLSKGSYKGLRIFLFVLTITYISLMIYVFIKTYQLRKKDWEKKSQLAWIISSFVLLFSGGIFLIIFSYLLKLSEFFLTLLVNLIVLFICLIFALGKYNPLTELAKLWKILDP